MKLGHIAFTPYTAPNHPKGGLLPEDVKYYALPGGGVADREAISIWGLVKQIKVTFLIPGEAN